MPSPVAYTYAKLAESLATGLVNLASDDVCVVLLNGYTVGTTQADAQFLADVLAHSTEVSTSGTGYTRQSLVSPTFTGASLVWTYTSATNPSWPSATFTCTHAVLVDRTPGSDATNPVLCFIDLGGAQTVTADTFTLDINASGLLTLTSV